MRKSLRIASMVLAALLFFSYDSLKAQVKIGGNPADVDEHAILELESGMKGLLLPRVGESGMTAILTSANEGFIVYYNGSVRQGPGLYVKQGGVFVKIASDDGTGGPWKLTGNANADINSYIGTPGGTAIPFVMKSNGLTGLTIGIDGKLKFGLVGAAALTDDILMIATDGTVTKKSLSTTSVTSLNTLQGNIELSFDAQTTTDAMNASITPGDPGILSLNFPVMAGASPAQPWGFMQLEDWNKLNNLTSANGITLLDAVSDPTLLNKGAKFERDATIGNEGKWVLTLNEASVAAAGIVSIGTQSFAGVKTFTSTNTLIDGGLRIEHLTPAGGVGNLFVEGTVTLPGTGTITPIVPATNYSVMVTEATTNLVKKIPVPGWKLTDKGISTITTQAGIAEGSTTGNLTFEVDATSAVKNHFAIESASPDKVTFIVPDASAAVGSRGLVTALDQTFGGNKTFANNVTVGAGTATTSNFNVNGSVGVKFRTITSGATLGPDDYIVMIVASAASTPVTLPDATTCAGRVYVIKRTPRVPVDVTGDESSYVNVSAAGGQFINGTSPSTKITVVHTSITLMSDGIGWQLLSRGTGL